MLSTLAFIAMGLSLFNYPAISVIVSAQLGLTPLESGLITSAFGLAYAAMQIPGGFLADRVGAGKAMLGSLLLAFVAPLIFASGGSFGSAFI